MSEKTVVINILGGSGIGKSTTAAALFAEMKYRGMHCELVREYVKTWVWQERKVGPFDQMYLLGKQSKYESILYGKVDYIVTDSPLLLCPVYELYYSGKNTVGTSAVSFIKDAESRNVKHVNFLLNRNHIFDYRGRYETLEQATEVDALIRDFLTKNDIPFTDINCEDRQRVQEILNRIQENVV